MLKNIGYSRSHIMGGFFSKLFGGKKKDENSVEGLVHTTVGQLIEKAGFDLSYEVTSSKNEEGEDQILIELSGADDGLLKDREGQMIDAVQLFVQRVVQHNFPEDRTKISVDCNGFLNESSQQLIELAEKLKNVAIEKGKPVYFRALPPKDRKVIHQYLSEDNRVKSRSVGDGLFKKIKIFPVKGASAEDQTAN